MLSNVERIHYPRNMLDGTTYVFSSGQGICGMALYPLRDSPVEKIVIIGNALHEFVENQNASSQTESNIYNTALELERMQNK